MLGLIDGFQPKFLKQYADLRTAALEATRTYVQEVHEGLFPDEAHSHE
jgi:3-methyl-2-oxobutanoate hydroxymethyltransferase